MADPRLGIASHRLVTNTPRIDPLIPAQAGILLYRLADSSNWKIEPLEATAGLVINLKAARALRLTVRPARLAPAPAK
jgi:hypothetical protein